MDRPTRRAVLGGAIAAPVLAGCSDTSSRKTAPEFDPGDWASVRAQFAVPEKTLNFSAYVFAPHPAPVRAAIERHRAGMDADAISYLHEHEVALDGKVRGAAASYLGAAATEIALTGSTTMGLGLLYAGLRLKAGQEVLTTEHDFYSTHESLRLRSERDGVKVRRVRLYDDPARASAEEMVERLLKGLGPRTRVVAVTWVHSGTGVKLPVRRIADAVRELNRGRDPGDRALLCVDGVHGFGIENAGVRELGCDFLVSGTHKWLLGPRGTGLVYGWGDAWQAMTPVIPSFTSAAFAGWLGLGPRTALGATLVTPGGYHSFEHRWALAEAFAFHQAIGKARVQARTQEQATRLKAGLAALPGVTVVTPQDPALSSGIVCCSLPGRRHEEIVARLGRDHKIIASVTPYREDHLRFGPSILTTPEQVDRLVGVMRTLL